MGSLLSHDTIGDSHDQDFASWDPNQSWQLVTTFHVPTIPWGPAVFALSQSVKLGCCHSAKSWDQTARKKSPRRQKGLQKGRQVQNFTRVCLKIGYPKFHWLSNQSMFFIIYQNQNISCSNCYWKMVELLPLDLMSTSTLFVCSAVVSKLSELQRNQYVWYVYDTVGQ